MFFIYRFFEIQLFEMLPNTDHSTCTAIAELLDTTTFALDSSGFALSLVIDIVSLKPLT